MKSFKKYILVLQKFFNRQSVKGNNNVQAGGDVSITNNYYSKIDEKVKNESKENLIIIDTLLNENYLIWKKFGPESEIARVNPNNLFEYNIWNEKKKEIISNNKKICKLLAKSEKYFDTNERSIISTFRQHTDIFERNNGKRIDSRSYIAFPNELPLIIKKKIEEII